MYQKNTLAKAVKLALISSALALPAYSANAQDADANADEQTVERIEVTGSRIKRTELEGPAPLVIITAADLKDKGFNTAYDAVQSLSSATGTNQGQAFGGFTANAETVNFRGLGPNRTLVLLNGKRVANYPRAYNGQNNVFNLATIPIAAVERFEIVTGGNSAIYGSDALAGVLNIITKRGVDQSTLTGRLSQSNEGDADNTQFSFVTGGESEKYSWTMALDYMNQDALRGNQREWLDDRFDNPADVADMPEYATVLPRTLMAMQWNGGWKYMDPGAEACAQFQNLEHANRPSRGMYCGRDATGNSSLLNDRENTSLYLTGTYELNDDHAVTADVLYWTSDSASFGSSWWGSSMLRDEIVDGDNYLGNGYFYTPGDGNYNYLQRTWQEEELMGGKGYESSYEEQMLTATISLSGVVMEDYDYEVYLSRSQSKDEQSEYRAKKEAASDYFVSYDAATGAPSVNWDRWFKPLDQAGFDQIFGKNNSKSDSSVTTFGASLTGDLMDLEAGPIAFAATLEYEKSEYDINVHPRTLAKEGQGWAGLTGTEGQGDRSRTAVAVEFDIPVTDTLTANFAARYDKYNDETDVGGAPTYQLGLAYRPNEDWLLRANYGTTFRAPDLHNVFKDPSGSYFSVTDYTLEASCAALAEGNNGGVLLPGAELESLNTTCTQDFLTNYQVFGTQSGERRLKEETGESLTLGFVWDASDDLSISFDFYNILMEDAVRPYSVDKIMRFERDCYNGTEDINSTLCQNTIARIDRNGATGFNNSYEVDGLKTSFINAAMREQTGFDFTFDYSYDIEGAGTFSVETQYSHILSTKNQWFSDEDVDNDYRDNVFNNEFRSKITTRVAYTTDDWRFTLENFRYGSVNNDWDEGTDFGSEKYGHDRYDPYNLYNLGINYSINDNNGLRLGVVNLFNKGPQRDATEQSFPYFNIFAYPATSIIVGRQFSFEYNYTF